MSSYNIGLNYIEITGFYQFILFSDESTFRTKENVFSQNNHHWMIDNSNYVNYIIIIM